MMDFLEYMFINTISFLGLRFICTAMYIALIILVITNITNKKIKSEDEWKSFITENIKNKKIFASGLGLYIVSILITFVLSIVWFKALSFLGIHIALENIIPILIPILIFIFTFIRFFLNKDEFIKDIKNRLNS